MTNGLYSSFYDENKVKYKYPRDQQDEFVSWSRAINFTKDNLILATRWKEYIRP